MDSYWILTRTGCAMTHRRANIACVDEASAFLAACAGLAPGEARELRHGARLIAIVIGPRLEAPIAGRPDPRTTISDLDTSSPAAALAMMWA